MGTIFKIGKMWYVNYKDLNGQRKRKAISPYKLTAEKILKKIETDVAEGKYLDIKKSERILFRNFSEQYYDRHVKTENKSKRKQQLKIDILVRHFGEKYVHEITNKMILDFRSKRLDNVSPCTVNKDITLLKAMFNKAIQWKVLVGENPAKGIKMLPEDNGRTRWLDENEIEKLLLNCNDFVRPMVIVALGTGLRWGELKLLKRAPASNSNYVDFNHHVIYVHDSLSKSRKSRHIPLSKMVEEVLKRIPDNGTEYFFISPRTGKSIECIKNSFKGAVKKAGIEDFTWHDLRHSFASHLVKEGVSLYVVMTLLGHSSLKMTMRYAHLRPDELQQAVGLLDGEMLKSCQNHVKKTVNVRTEKNDVSITALSKVS